eukprot:7418194-Prorocentrum_lima.AAC.1
MLVPLGLCGWAPTAAEVDGSFHFPSHLESTPHPLRCSDSSVRKPTPDHIGIHTDGSAFMRVGPSQWR